MKPACLLICNDIADQAQALFEHWYQTEHLAERLSVPGFNSARRYAAVRAGHAWAALYELDNIAVLGSAAYRTRLENPSELTRTVMPHFRRMVRSCLVLQADTGQGTGGMMDMLVLPEPVDTAKAQELIQRWLSHTLFLRLRQLHQAQDAALSVKATAEAQLRGAADQAWPAVWLLEWAADSVDELPDTQAQALAHGLPLLPAQGGRYRLCQEMK
ncbi:MAG: hypothetical protein EXR37_03560 [Limnohabitans sp.]|nr:hypothetical protein [Limnohabitans sp.]